MRMTRPLSFLCLLLLLPCSIRLAAKTLRIASTPPGATVELDGTVVGTTPFEQDFPQGYFRRPFTVLEKRLGHPVRLRLTLSGYVTKEVVLTNGPKQWLDLHRNNRGEYWLFKSDSFRFDLLPLPSDTPAPATPPSPDTSKRELSPRELTFSVQPRSLLFTNSNSAETGLIILLEQTPNALPSSRRLWQGGNGNQMVQGFCRNPTSSSRTVMVLTQSNAPSNLPFSVCRCAS